MVNYSATFTLLVDRDHVARQSAAAILREMGYPQLLEASSGSDAWAIIKKSTISLVISGWSLLKEMSGLGLLKVVRADPAYATIPFILTVDEVTQNQVVEAGQAGVTEIIVQPFSKEIFQRKVDRSLKGDDDPKSIETRKLHDLGLTLMRQGRYEEALASFKRITLINETAEVYYNLGYIKAAQKRYEEAIAAFRRATQIDQAFAQAFQMMGEVYAKLGRMDEARKCLEKAAGIFMEKKQDAEAEDSFMKVLEINPNTPNIYNSLGIVYRRQGKFEEAMRMYIKALKVNPFDENIHYNLGRVYVNMKRFREAAHVLRKALHINPDFAEAGDLLKSIEMGQGLD